VAFLDPVCSHRQQRPMAHEQPDLAKATRLAYPAPFDLKLSDRARWGGG